MYFSSLCTCIVKSVFGDSHLTCMFEPKKIFTCSVCLSVCLSVDRYFSQSVSKLDSVISHISLVLEIQNPDFSAMQNFLAIENKRICMMLLIVLIPSCRSNQWSVEVGLTYTEVVWRVVQTEVLVSDGTWLQLCHVSWRRTGKTLCIVDTTLPRILKVHWLDFMYNLPQVYPSMAMCLCYNLNVEQTCWQNKIWWRIEHLCFKGNRLWIHLLKLQRCLIGLWMFVNLQIKIQELYSTKTNVSVVSSCLPVFKTLWYDVLYCEGYSLQEASLCTLNLNGAC